MQRTLHRAPMAALAALIAALLLPGTAAADLGNCVSVAGQPHQGGYEPALNSIARGVSAVITVRTPDLCNNPVDPFDSGSTAYVMLTNESDGIANWYQVGYYRVQGEACGRQIYSQQLTNAGALTDRVGPCATTGVKYRFRIERKVDDLGLVYWRTYVLVEATQAVFWEAPAPASLGFTLEDAEYSSEVINEHDQSGGGNLSRMKLESAYWKNNVEVWVAADMPAAERFCQLCPNPYNSNWLTNRAFEVWTDGF